MKRVAKIVMGLSVVRLGLLGGLVSPTYASQSPSEARPGRRQRRRRLLSRPPRPMKTIVRVRAALGVLACFVALAGSARGSEFLSWNGRVVFRGTDGVMVLDEARVSFEVHRVLDQPVVRFACSEKWAAAVLEDGRVVASVDFGKRWSIVPLPPEYPDGVLPRIEVSDGYLVLASNSKVWTQKWGGEWTRLPDPPLPDLMKPQVRVGEFALHREDLWVLYDAGCFGHAMITVALATGETTRSGLAARKLVSQGARFLCVSRSRALSTEPACGLREWRDGSWTLLAQISWDAEGVKAAHSWPFGPAVFIDVAPVGDDEVVMLTTLGLAIRRDGEWTLIEGPWRDQPEGRMPFAFWQLSDESVLLGIAGRPHLWSTPEKKIRPIPVESK